jgi:uncharacterized protein YxeA
MKRIIATLAFLMLVGCSSYTASYRDSMQGTWELVEIRNQKGDMIFKEDGTNDVVELSFRTEGSILIVTAQDEQGKEMKVRYQIKEDGRLINMGGEKPNMYVLDIHNDKVVLVDRRYDGDGADSERLLVFKKTQE